MTTGLSIQTGTRGLFLGQDQDRRPDVRGPGASAERERDGERAPCDSPYQLCYPHLFLSAPQPDGTSRQQILFLCIFVSSDKIQLISNVFTVHLLACSGGFMTEQGLPLWLRQSSGCLQCERPGFDPWVGKFPGEGNGNPLQYYCLENPIGGGAW